nr:DoxX family membrane protein [Oceanobacillus saliphilus]
MFAPLISNAHVKWFTEEAASKESIVNILSPFFIVFSLFVAIVLAAIPQLLPRLMNLEIAKKIEEKLAALRIYSRYLLKYGTALALAVQAFSGSMFAPEFSITEAWQYIVFWIAIVLLLIPHHFATKLASIVLLGLFIMVWSYTGWFHMLDYGFYIAIFFVLFVEKSKLEKWGFPFLYLGTGLSLCWVAVEKWVYPAMTLDIIERHAVPTFGFEPSVFIVMAAFVEFVVGYLLVVGILNRLLAALVTILFILTTMLFGITEIIGHGIIHIILLIFIIEGVSFYYPPIKMHKSRIDQMIFVFLNFIFVLATFILIYYRFA